MLQHLSKYIANAFSPLLAPTYGVFLALWASYLCHQALHTRLVVLFVVFGITCMLPCAVIGILYKTKVVNDMEISNRSERTYPYACAVACCLTAIFYLVHVHAPFWLTGFMLGVAAICIAMLIINLVWKVSAHTAGMGGLVALLFFLRITELDTFSSLWPFCTMIILSGIVGSIRIYQGYHTLAQVLAGFAIGYTCTHLSILLLRF